MTRKVMLVGDGAVGSTFANDLLQHCHVDETIIAGKKLRSYPEFSEEALTKIESDVRKKGGKIIKNKGATFYGVAMMLTQIVSAILDNRSISLPLSAPINGEYGIKHELYLGTPAVIDGSGISHVIEVKLSADEKKKMLNSADKMQEVLATIKI